MPSQHFGNVDAETKDALRAASKQNHFRTVLFWFAAMFIGGILGYMQIAQVNSLFGFISSVFTRLFQFIAVPIIALAVITTLATLGARQETRRIFCHAVFYTISTTLAASLVALLLFIWISPENLPTSIAAAGSQSIPENLGNLSYADHFLSVIPNNLLKPFVSGNVLSVLLIAVAFGLGLAFMPRTENREMLLKGIFGLQELLFVLIRALLAVLPIGIMAFTGQLASELEAGIIVGSLGQYVSVVLGGNLIQFFIVIPLFLILRGLKPSRIFRGMFPALAVALFSKSSAGTLPVTMASAEKNLHLDPRVTRFVLPICTTINMNGCAAFILVTSLFLMRNAGIDLSCGSMLVWVLISVLAAVGNAGVPMGCYFLTISLMASMQVPVEIMGVILPVYAVIDMVETCVNVWSDSAVASMTDHDLQGKLPDQTA
ncbi:MAG: dicarboxylate/amino acid:cation symporter [Desulfovibrionaceae bacterium]|nr:dicarboxylate/amino acid:cation symporter [Desulfovibrionaceae bacterium]